jgi:hypothetical protein
LAAKKNLIASCVVTEDDISRGDEFVHEHVQRARLEWRQRAIAGEQSAFVILLVSPRVAISKPTQELLGLAKLFLGTCLRRRPEEIVVDAVYLEELLLQVPRASGKVETWRWDAGINYFAANGDGRWWRDHRIPGGLAFSINSVGHMVKAAMIRDALKEYEKALTLQGAEGAKHRITGLSVALRFAMETINDASNAVSGPATSLRQRPTTDKAAPPASIPTHLASFDFRTYLGWYHTDYTLPSLYFREDVERPSEAQQVELDFTYLHDDSIDNPEYVRMGQGERMALRFEEPARIGSGNWKRRTWVPEVADLTEAEAKLLLRRGQPSS